MDNSKIEILVIEKTLEEVKQNNLTELNDLQLAFIGGGIGETAL